MNFSISNSTLVAGSSCKSIALFLELASVTRNPCSSPWKNQTLKNLRMKYPHFPNPPISELPETAVADFPGGGQSKVTTPISRKHVKYFGQPQPLSPSSTSSDSNTKQNQGPPPVIRLRPRSWRRYVFPSVTYAISHHDQSRKERKVAGDFFRSSTSGWKSITTTPFSFEVYPAAVLPFTMSPTPTTSVTSFSDDVGKEHVKSSDFAFYVPVLLMLGSIILLGMILLFLKRRKKLEELRHKLLPVYHFAPGEEEEWGVLLDEDNLFKKSSKSSKSPKNF